METNGSRFRRLVQPDRVHRDVYRDEAVFRAEMERIHGRAWGYVGHESQVPRPGDFFATTLGTNPVVLVRHDDSTVRVLRNRCGHKGATVVGRRCGSSKYFRCMYHGWTYRTDGSLHAVPQRKGYEGTGIDLDDPVHGMTPLAKVGTYRGFVFAAGSDTAPGLDAFLGDARHSLDNMADRAPAGELVVAPGTLRVVIRCNWKMILENLNDLMHPMVAHVSSTEAAEQEGAAREGEPLPPEIPLLTSNGWPYSFWNELRVQCCPFGHSLMGGINTPRDTDPTFASYVETLERAHGRERTDEILSYPGVMTLIYPNLSIHTAYQQMRVLHPVAVDRTIVDIFTFRLAGAPEGMYQRARIYANLVNAPSSIGNADDVEAFMRVHRGLADESMEWITQYRNAGQDESVEGGEMARPGTSELPIRNQFRAWLGYMTGESQYGS